MEGATISPKDVVDQFVKMDVEGARLTPEGWYQADALFVRPSKQPHLGTILVIARHYAVSPAGEKADTIEFDMGYEEIGRIDIVALRFAPSHIGTETRSFDKYTVVMSEKPRRPNANASKWRIEGSQPSAMHLTAAAAIRFVSQLRAKTTDPVLQHDADLTLRKLEPYR